MPTRRALIFHVLTASPDIRKRAPVAAIRQSALKKPKNLRFVLQIYDEPYEITLRET